METRFGEFENTSDLSDSNEEGVQTEKKRKSQELREKVKLLFNDPISHRNPHNTEVYLAKAPNRSKHPNAI